MEMCPASSGTREHANTVRHQLRRLSPFRLYYLDLYFARRRRSKHLVHRVEIYGDAFVLLDSNAGVISEPNH